MADKVSDVNIEKGVHLSVVVELCVENIIAVCLKHKGKEYRGVLLECNTGRFPGGVPYSPFSTPLKAEFLKQELSYPQTNADPHLYKQHETHQSSANFDGQKPETPALVNRYSYNNDPLFTPQRVSPELTVVEMKPVGPRKRTIRDIRLRPRQTLCSNCKCAIHEGKKNRNPTVPVKNDNVEEVSDRRLRTRTRERNCSTSLPAGTRKRRCPSSSPMVLLEDITRKSNRPDSFKNSKSGSDIKTRQGLRQSQEKIVNGDATIYSANIMPYKPKISQSKSTSEDEATCNLHSQQAATMSSEEPSDIVLPKFRKNKPAANDFITKPTPAIRISIGDGDVVKIPPRLPEMEVFSTSDLLSSPKEKTNDTKESQIHRKAKKSGRKSRDKERHRSIETLNGDSAGTNNDQVSSRPQKKHKKKHRHRHPSPDNSVITQISCSSPPVTLITPITPVSTIAAITPVSMVTEVKEKSTQQLPTKIKVGDVFIDVVNISESESDRETCNDESVKDENYENTSPSFDDIANNRPRLVYTLKQDQGLSRVATTPPSFSPEQSPRYLVKTSPSIMPMANSPHRRKNASPGRVVSASPNVHFSNSPSCLLKDYPLRSKTSSTLPGQPPDLLSIAEHNVMHPSEDSQSHSSGLDSHISDISDDSGEEQQSDDIFSNAPTLNHDQEDKGGGIKPLMMKIQTQNVNGCLLEEGREIHVGDIVWGKIQGFPWWPGRVSGITVTQRDNDVVITQLANVAWFGSNTMSHVRCCDLFPFLEDFKVRYNKKKKGQYRQAIKQATIAARRLQLHADSTPDIMEFTD